MEESKPLQQSDAEIIGIIDALTVGLAVLQAVLNLRRGEASEVDLRERGVVLRIATHPASNRVVVLEV
jgi:hypothetical protein